MNAENLQYLLQNPNKITETDLEAMEELVVQNPYFQIGHLLIAKYAQDNESMLAPQKVRRAAVYAFDRKLLRELIHLNPKDNQEGELRMKYDETKSFFDLVVLDLDKENTSKLGEPHNNHKKETTIEWQNPASEANALQLFNDGKIQEAHAMYSEIASQNPDKYDEFVDKWLKLSSNLPKEAFEDDNDDNNDNHNHTNLVQENKEMTDDKTIVEIEVENNDQQNNETDADTVVISAQENIENEEVLEEKIPEIIVELEQNIIIKDTENSKPTDEIDAFFQDIATDNLPDYTHLNEGIALGLYYDGKEKEAIDMYKKLIELYPDRQEYYQEQLITLIGKTAYQKNIAPLIPKIQKNEAPQVIPKDISEASVILLEKDRIVAQGELEVSENIEKQDLTPVIDGIKEEAFFENIGTQKALEEPGEIVKLTAEEKPFFEGVIAQASEGVAGQSEEEIIIASQPLDKINITEIEDQDAQVILLTESQAIALFNQGKLLDAVEVYQQLGKQNPIKTSYYESQIALLQKSIDDNIKVQNATEQTPSATIVENAEINEGVAIRLFTQGKIVEAIAIYEQLIVLNPDKTKHYLRQIDVLKD